MKLFMLGFVCLGFFASTDAFANTPDGETPAVEKVCDDYTGRAFGICNAYCEAIDCDDPASNASPTACDQLEDKFAKATGEKMPACEAGVNCEEQCKGQYYTAEQLCFDGKGYNEECLVKAKRQYEQCAAGCAGEPTPIGDDWCTPEGEKACYEVKGTYEKYEDGSCTCKLISRY